MNYTEKIEYMINYINPDTGDKNEDAYAAGQIRGLQLALDTYETTDYTLDEFHVLLQQWITNRRAKHSCDLGFLGKTSGLVMAPCLTEDRVFDELD